MLTDVVDYETIIGLEVHAQLLTRSKCFVLTAPIMPVSHHLFKPGHRRPTASYHAKTSVIGYSAVTRRPVTGTEKGVYEILRSAQNDTNLSLPGAQAVARRSRSKLGAGFLACARNKLRNLGGRG